MILRLRFLLLTMVVISSCTTQDQTSAKIITSQIAFAFPVDNIEIDGDLSDWPDSFDKYRINAFGNPDQSDTTIDDRYFQVGYHQATQSLYMGISYPNDSSKVIDVDAHWSKQDSYSFYIDEQHLPFGSGVARYTFNDTLFKTSNPEQSWDPNLKLYLDQNKLEKQVRTYEHHTIVELKYQLNHPITIGDAYGINHMIIDANSEAVFPKAYVWSGHPYSDRTSGQLGTLFIADKETSMGAMEGTVSLKGNTEGNPVLPQQIILQNNDHPRQWTKVDLDAKGHFNVELPVGQYNAMLDNPLIKRGERYVRLMEDPDWASIQLNTNRVSNLKLKLSEIPPPDLVPEAGILQDGFSSEDAQQIDEFVKIYMEYYDIPGVLLSVIYDGKIVHSNTYGYTNQFTEAPINSETIFEGASMTKPMFAFAVMRLVDQGLVDLDRPLYLDAAPPKDIAEHPWSKLITPRLVLSHQTGLPNWADDTEDGRLYFKFKPGTDVGYSGEGFTYLTRAVEQITQKSITTLMQDEVVKTLGLRDMYFKNTEGLNEITANGHVFNKARLKEIPEHAEMASSVHTNAIAYANFLLAISRREGLSKDAYNTMINRAILKNDHTEQGQRCQHYYGLGWSLRDSPFFGLSYGHSGSNGDFKCTSTYYEDTGNGFVVMTNSNTGHMLQYHLHNLLNIGTKQVDP